ncbi:expansin-like EG45 domain-containing protein, partial [Haematococcus lacustris]
MLGGPGMCARVANGGALALKAWNGVFSNAVALEFWTYVGVVGWEGTNATIPDITVSIGGDQGGCAPVRLMNLKPTMFQPKCVPFCADYWWRYRVYLPVFGGAWPRSVINNPASFQGCGGMSSWQLNQIQFRHDGYGGSGDKYFCLDNLSLS